MPNKHSLFETLIISINDTIVKNFLLKKIQFNDISKLFLKLISRKEFVKYKKVYPSNIDQIIMLNNKISQKVSKIIV
jgi:1-deoxy-D-xylulose-5-phosphate reductoisomerase